MECGLAAMLRAGPAPGRTFPFLVLFFVVFVLYLVAVRIALSAPAQDATDVRGTDGWGDSTGLVIMGAACLFRLTFIAAQPALGNDLYRYLWDGRVTLAGGNPYLEEPAARSAPFPRSTGAAPPSASADGPDFARLEHKEVPTIYPPLAQALFLAGASLHAGVYGIKLLIVVADLGVFVALRALLRARGQPCARALIYAWNPLAVTETAWSGHIEPVAILFALIAAGAIIQKRESRATVALTLGGLVKLFPLVLLIPLLRSIRARFLLIVPLLLAAAYWPFRAAGWRLLAGFREYADRWLANESLFAVIHAAIAWIDPTPWLKNTIAWARRSIPRTGGLDLLYGYVFPLDLAKGACALLLVAFAAALWRRRVEPLRGCFLLTCAVILLSPTVHPWYVLWILPWLCFFPSRAFILLTGLVSLAYVNLGAAGRDSETYPFIRVAEYAPFYALLCADWLRGRVRATRGNLAGSRTG
jgi:alpha-1,6-mannosyltransferase